MLIKDLKTLEKLVKLCKKQGINAIKIGNIEFSIESGPKAIRPIEADIPEAKIKVPKFNGNLQPDKIETDALTDEQLMFYSVKEEPGTEGAQ
jgi:hypothetical protein